MGLAMNMGMNTGGGFGGLSDTGAAPDSSGSHQMMGVGMHPMNMYQTNFTGSSLA
jgi:hypothetical protein